LFFSTATEADVSRDSEPGRSKVVKALPGRNPDNQGYHGGKGSPPEADIEYQEKRRSPRYSFIASAELVEEKADVRIATRVSELSLHGCYLDMMNPFPKDTMVLVKISAGDSFFEAKAKIIYSQPNMGAGVGFLHVEPHAQAALNRWLDEAEKDRQRLAD
jgi:hypothetical protein